MNTGNIWLFSHGNECTKREPLLMMRCHFFARSHSLSLSFSSSCSQCRFNAFHLPSNRESAKVVQGLCCVQNRSNCFQFAEHTGRTDNRTSLLGSSLYLIIYENLRTVYKRQASFRQNTFFSLRFSLLINSPEKLLSFSRCSLAAVREQFTIPITCFHVKMKWINTGYTVWMEKKDQLLPQVLSVIET